MRLFDLLLVQYLILTVLFGIVVYAHHNYVLNTEEQTELAWQQEAQERGWDAIVTFYYWIDLRQMLIRNLANSIETKDLESSFVTLANKYLTIDDSNASLNMKFYLYNNQQLTSAKTSENKAIEKAEFDSVFEDFKGADFTTIIENGGVNQILIGYQVPSTTAWAFTVAPISDIFYSISQFSLPPGIKLKVSHKNNNISYNEASTNPQWSFTVEEVVGKGGALNAAIALAKKVANQSPVAVSACKKLIQKNRHMPISQALSEERESFVSLFSTADQKEGVNAFLEKRKPIWSNK